MLDHWHDLSLGRGIRAELVGYYPLGRATLLARKPCEQTARRLCIPVLLHDLIEHISILIDGAS
jgi:hypothetical protein